MYGSSQAAAPSDLNRPFRQTALTGSGSSLLRYRSAPSSLLAEICEDFSPDSDSIIARFLSSDLGASANLPPPPPPPPAMVTSSSAMLTSSFDQHHQNHHQISKDNSLVRQSSSPAGLFSHLDNNRYGIMRGVSGNNSNMLRRQSSLMSQISENESMDDWEDTKVLTENISNSFSPNKRARENQTEHQNGLSHQLSLPKEMEAIEKFLQFQDSVPCKIRAKRGCATHPRSIAERVRRTKISERMRKLQELVPNMDKQTNTADMLDLAVDYIKELQKQVKTISDSRADCTCSTSKQKPCTHPAV